MRSLTIDPHRKYRRCFVARGSEGEELEEEEKEEEEEEEGEQD